jgi:hypothetical protein
MSWAALFTAVLSACTTTGRPQDVAPLRVPAGSRLQVALIDGVSTAGNSAGDRFTASLVAPIVVDGHTVLARGTRVTGSVADIHEAEEMRGPASLMLVLQSVEQDGDDILIATRPLVAAAQPRPGWVGNLPNQPDLYYPPETRLHFTLASELETPPAVP